MVNHAPVLPKSNRAEDKAMTISEAVADLAALGLRSKFRPAIEPETGAMVLATKTPAHIVDGALVGCEIVRVPGGFRVWTSQVRKAERLAKQHGIAARCGGGEADFVVPVSLADELLPQLGARIRREVTEEQRQVLRARLAKARNAHVSPLKPTQEGTSGGLGA